MDNYDQIILVYMHRKIEITYEEYLMYMASPEKDWDYIEFRKDDKLHRLDGPARVWDDGTKVWVVNGKWNRLDGPAVEWADGRKSWYIDGKYYTTEQAYLKAVEMYKTGG